MLSAENYARFPDFRRFVIDLAVREINNLSDLTVTYIVLKDSRKFTKIDFMINVKKDVREKTKTWIALDKTIKQRE